MRAPDTPGLPLVGRADACSHVRSGVQPTKSGRGAGMPRRSVRGGAPMRMQPTRVQCFRRALCARLDRPASASPDGGEPSGSAARAPVDTQHTLGWPIQAAMWWAGWRGTR